MSSQYPTAGRRLQQSCNVWSTAPWEQNHHHTRVKNGTEIRIQLADPSIYKQAPRHQAWPVHTFSTARYNRDFYVLLPGIRWHLGDLFCLILAEPGVRNNVLGVRPQGCWPRPVWLQKTNLACWRERRNIFFLFLFFVCLLLFCLLVCFDSLLCI